MSLGRAIHTDEHTNAQWCAWGFWVLYGTSNNPILHPKLAKGRFGLLSTVNMDSFVTF